MKKSGFDPCIHELKNVHGYWSLNNNVRERDNAMTYHIFENDNGWTMLHYSDCSFVNHGQEGVQPNARGEQGRWHGPYPTYQEVSDAAKEMNWSIHNCEKCNPS